MIALRTAAFALLSVLAVAAPAWAFPPDPEAVAEHARAFVDDQPDCAVLGTWTFECADGGTFVGCRPDSAQILLCSVHFEGQGGEIGAGPVLPLAESAGAMAGAVPGRALATAEAIAGAGPQLVTVILQEGTDWLGWSADRAVALAVIVVQAAVTIADILITLTPQLILGTTQYVAAERNELDTLLFAVTNEAFGLFAVVHLRVDSGPVTLHLSTQKPGGPGCDDTQATQLGSHDGCGHRVLADLYAGVRLECNSYATILWRQECGGWATSAWSQASTASGRSIDQRARLILRDDGVPIVQDATGRLVCESSAWYYFVSVVEDHTVNNVPSGGVSTEAVGFPGLCRAERTPDDHWLIEFESPGFGVAMEGRFEPIGDTGDLASSTNEVVYDESDVGAHGSARTILGVGA